MLVVIAIIGILASMMMPALQSALTQARQMSCANNFKQTGLVIFNYASDHDGWIIEMLNGGAETYWFINSQLLGYANNSDNYLCPEQETAYTIGYNSKNYSTNYGLSTCVARGLPSGEASVRVRRLTELTNSVQGASRTPIAADCTPNRPFIHKNSNPSNDPFSDAPPGGIDAVHNSAGNFLFGDFHVRALQPPYAPTNKNIEWLNPDNVIYPEYIRD